MSHSLDSEIERLREVLWSDRDPHGRAFASLAEAYRQRGDLPLARSMVVEGLERLPAFASGHVVAGRIHRDLGSAVEADQSFRRVLDLDPENAVALRAMGELAEERGSHAEAAEYFRRLSVLVPDEEDPDEPASDASIAPVPVDDLGPDQEEASAEGILVGPEDALPPAEAVFEPAPEPAVEPAPEPAVEPAPEAVLPSIAPEEAAMAEVAAPEPGRDQVEPEGERVPVADLAPDDDSFDFAVTDLDDVAAGDVLRAEEPVASDDGAVSEWSWTPEPEEEPVAAVPDVEEVDATEVAAAAPTPVEELAPTGPRPADAVPISSLAPDAPVATAEAVAPEVPPVPVADLGPEPAEDAAGPAVAEAASGDSESSDSEEGAGDSDDFQAWLERNSP